MAKSIPAFHGLLVLDKPTGMTSRAALDHALRWFPPGTRMGHTGTLDPLATGVLVLAIGTATRLVEYVQDMPKTYEADIRLGARSDTDDAEGTIIPVGEAKPPSLDQILAQVQTFIGAIDQVPPAFSAAKVLGRRAYDLARKGKEVSLEPRQVTISSIRLVHFEYPLLSVVVQCGKGTYIRSLARDLGEKLGCGGYIQNLRRTQVGPFTTNVAFGVDADEAMARARLQPLAAAVAGLKRIRLAPDQLQALRQGKKIPLPRCSIDIGEGPATCQIAVFDGEDQLAGIAYYDDCEQMLKPIKVLAVESR